MAENQIITPRIALNPPVYYCPRAKGSLTMDGNIHKDFWKDVPFTEEFCDISGKDFPTPRFRTRAKLCWDDENLYISALLEDGELWATITEHDSVMYYDNDFEVFMDPSSSTHSYMEMEMNAFGTTWDLMLTKPYRDGGRSVSGWELKGLETAVHIDGTLNAPDKESKSWSVEVKIPFQSVMETYTKEENPPELERCYPSRTAPRTGDFWRMNFSRVQWLVDVENGTYTRRTGADGKVLPEDNWVWAPTGLIDIHYPESWSFVCFTEGDAQPPVPEDEQTKLMLRALYYRQHAIYEEKGCFATTLSQLTEESLPVNVEATSHCFELTAPSTTGGTVMVRSDGFATVLPKV